jgi:hypothetical protein
LEFDLNRCEALKERNLDGALIKAAKATLGNILGISEMCGILKEISLDMVSLLLEDKEEVLRVLIVFQVVASLEVLGMIWLRSFFDVESFL